MDPLNLAFLWHMHQPYYKDPLAGVYRLPWVRLHGVRSYYDMAMILQDFPEIRVTINLVPSLLLQILDYQEGRARDLFLEVTSKPAAELNAADRYFILRYFFMANRDTMIKPLERYHTLLQERGIEPFEENLKNALEKFKTQDYLDLQVLFNLAWFGFKALEEYPELGQLRSKGRDYTEEDKKTVIDCQQAILEKLIALYQRLSTTGLVELTTSPFYHPILPLLIDTDIEKRLAVSAALPERFQVPEDAKAQVTNAIQFHGESFGRRPTGMWPSEGAVCPEMIPILSEAGIEWIGTDEEILFHSIPAGPREKSLYQPYQIEHEGHSIQTVFRDQELSNLISFSYARMGHTAAVEDFLFRLTRIHESTAKQMDSALVTVILDGENPWETYLENGRLFLVELYSRLSASPAIKTVTLGKHLKEHPAGPVIQKIHSGSWSNHDFHIWIGNREKNMAWDYIRRVRENLLLYMNMKANQIPPTQREMVFEAIFAAEGSDWFWWFGDDFFSENAEEFDALFRAHLIHAYKVLGLAAPEFLNQSIRSAGKNGAIV